MSYEQIDAFPDCKKDSPRLAWMKRYNIYVRPIKRAGWPRMYLALDLGAQGKRINCRAELEPSETKDQALEAWARDRKIPMWHEEEYLNTLKQKRAGGVAEAPRDLTPKV